MKKTIKLKRNYSKETYAVGSGNRLPAVDNNITVAVNLKCLQLCKPHHYFMSFAKSK